MPINNMKLVVFAFCIPQVMRGAKLRNKEGKEEWLCV